MSLTLVAALTPPDHVDLIVEGADPRVTGQRVMVLVERVVHVVDDRPVHGESVLAASYVEMDPAGIITSLELPERLLYEYEGEKVRVEVWAAVRRERNGWFSRDEDVARVRLELPAHRGAPSQVDAELVEPKDAFQIAANLRALDPSLQRSILGAGAAYSVLVSVLGISAVFNADGCLAFLALVVGLVGGTYTLSAAEVDGGTGLYKWFKRLFREYADLRLADVGVVRPGDAPAIGEVVKGAPFVDLERPRLRIVACNLECGQYRRGSGTDVRTVSFEEPFGAVVLFDQTVARWRANAPVHEVFDGPVAFDEVFAHLLPPQHADPAHGVRVRWEVQLLVPELVDLELVGASDVFAWPVPAADS